MTIIPPISRLAFPGILAATMCCAVCLAQNDAKPPVASASADEKALPRYITSAEVAKMPACSAKFTKTMEYGGEFATAEGKRFVIGDIRGEQWVWHFVNSLREGRTYKLPETFTNYQSATHYGTSNEIAAIAPCTATLASRSPCSSMFVTAEGKWLAIGNPGSGARVSHFIWMLKDEETCKLPDAFREFVAATNYATAAEITAMPPRRAILVHAWNGEAYFKEADGKGFFIGGERGGTDLDRFLRTLEEDKMYQFPDVFVSYQKPKK
jgi:hypothetical protein